MSKNQREKYLGKTNYNSQGYLMTLTEYNGYNDIVVEFAEPYSCKVKTGTRHFLNGSVNNPYAPTVFDVGIVGNKYPKIIKDTKKQCKEYSIWYSMMRRCFSQYFKNQFPTYKDVSCDPIWFYYEHFYDWIHQQENYEAIKGLNYNIDKDILIKGNKYYSPERCVLVPQNVNKLLTKNNARRGKYPIGVIFEENRGYYSAYCNDGAKQRHLNYYTTAEKAFIAYKEYKENVIKRIASEEFKKGTITKECYEALINYKVEITD